MHWDKKDMGQVCGFSVSLGKMLFIKCLSTIRSIAGIIQDIYFKQYPFIDDRNKIRYLRLCR